MSGAAPLLPEGFAALEPFALRWAGADIAARAQLRDSSTAEERAAFHAAARELVPIALDQLDAKPLAALDERERRLLDLILAFGHVALAEEVQGESEPRHAELRVAMRITAPADSVR